MTEIMAPWEPPITGTDAEQLVGSLDRLRATFRWKTDGLDLEQLTARIPSSELSLGVLLKHLALVEDDVMCGRFAGEAPVLGSQVPEGRDIGEWQFGIDDGESAQRPSLRRHVCDLLEEYGRHTGHADLLREAIDGRVGEDPPSDWRPTGSGACGRG